VILSGIAPDVYADALVAAAQNLSSTRLMGCHMVARRTFHKRVARLLSDGMPRVSRTSTLRAAAVLFAGAVLAIGLLSGQETVYKKGRGVSAPRILRRIDPQYTPNARADKLSGTVLLSMVVGADGLAHDIKVMKRVGDGLDEKAVEAVRKWRFVPGQKEGVPVAVRAQVEVNFKLR
jgi:TonB family protein